MQAGEHRQVHHPHPLADPGQPSGPVPEFLESPSQSDAVGLHLSSADRVHPNDRAIVPEPANQMLAARRVPAPIVGEDQKRR